MKVFLTGMPGCGKSTFGRKVAAKLDSDFIDLDKVIVEKEGLSISEIFETKGEKYFREIESALLKETIINKNQFIMATGGGAPCFFDNMNYMNENGITIYIDTPIEILLERLTVSGINKRPLLKQMGEEYLYEGLVDKLKLRLPFYNMANHVLAYHRNLEYDIAACLTS